VGIPSRLQRDKSSNLTEAKIFFRSSILQNINLYAVYHFFSSCTQREYSQRRTHGSHALLPGHDKYNKYVPSLFLDGWKEKEGCTGQARKIEQSERPEIAWPGNINFEGDSQRCRKSSENFECSRNRGASSSRVYKDALTWEYHRYLHLWLSSSFLPSLFLPRFLVSRRPFRPSFLPSSAIMIPTRSRLVIILMASCTQRPSEVQQKESWRNPYAKKLIVKSNLRMLRRELYGKREFARIN